MSKAAGVGKYSLKPEFYVYALLDPTKPGAYKYGKWKFDFEPFYIGKGKSQRLNDHTSLCTHNPFKARKIAKIERSGAEIICINKKSKLTEKQALDLEINLIEKIGRRDMKLGPLINLTDGGEGLTNPSKLTREKIGKASIGRQAFLGKTHTDEAKRKIGLASTGRIFSDKTRKKMSLNMKGDRNPFFGKQHTEQTRERISEAKMGTVSWNAGIPMRESSKKKLSEAKSKSCIAGGKKFPSMQEAANALGIHYDTLRRRIKAGLKGYSHSR